MGKTTLAKAVARRDEVVDTFYDGVLRITFGTRPQLVESINDLCRVLGDQDVQLSGLSAAESHLRGSLEAISMAAGAPTTAKLLSNLDRRGLQCLHATIARRRKAAYPSHISPNLERTWRDIP